MKRHDSSIVPFLELFIVAAFIVLCGLLTGISAPPVILNSTKATMLSESRPGQKIEAVAYPAHDRPTALPAPKEPALPAGLSQNWWAEAQKNLRESEYHVTWQEKSVLSDGRPLYQAPNRMQNFRTYFDEKGITLVDRTAEGNPALFTMAVVSVGRPGGKMIYEVGTAEVTAMRNHVELRRKGLSEWYRNTEEGLEQGFTIWERPTGKGGLSVAITVAGAKARLKGERIVLTSETTGRKLEYGKLAVKDAAGRDIPAALEAPDEGTILIAMNDSQARYPVTVDPLITSTYDAILESNQASALFGISVSGAGDVNGDGFADVIVGAKLYDNGGINTGAAFVYHGSAGGISTTPATALVSTQENAQMGSSVSGAGDINGDGYSDVVVGAYYYDNGEVDEGAAFVYHGGADGINTTPSTALESGQAYAQFGNSVSGAGDVNGDGYADIVVGSYYYDNGQPDTGAAFVYYGSASGINSASLTQLVANPDQGYAWLGSSVSGAGDVNGDGYDDVIVGANHYDNGQVDEGAVFVYAGSAPGIDATPMIRLESNQGSAFFGNSVSGAGDVNGDGYADIIVGANQYVGSSSNQGAAFLYQGSATGIGSAASATLNGPMANAYFGASVAGAGDVNGDGYADVIIGANGYSNGHTAEGAALVYQGSAAGIKTVPFATLESNQAYVGMGFSVGGAGDVNGDGYADVIVGAPRYDMPEADEGAAFVYHGSAGGVSTAYAVRLESNQAGAWMAGSVSGAGDVNGDGYADVIVGASLYDNGQTDEGAAFVYHGSAAGLSTNYATMLESNQAGARMGHSVSGAGDVNGDGYADVIVGAYGGYGQYDEVGAFVYHGSAAGVSSAPATLLESNRQQTFLGVSVSGAGDVNGDGYADVIVGDSFYNNSEYSEGAAFVYHGSAAGVSSIPAVIIESYQVNAGFGSSVSSVGDVNGDGYADVIVGAYLYDFGETDEGAAFVYHGSAGGVSTAYAVRLESNQAGAWMAGSVSGAGDVNGDGYADVIVGASLYDNGQTDEGAAFVYHGSASGINSTPATTLESNQADAYMGISVSGAGDVNGDGYADVIVGASLYDNGQTDEGAAFVYHGSASGINSTPATTLESNQAYAQMGYSVSGSVSGAGDVNGDGYADVIVGACWYDNGESDEGAAFVYYGNSSGRLVLARQMRGDASGQAVHVWGASNSLDSFEIRMNSVSPSGRSRVKIEAEACPAGTPFGDASCVRTISPEWEDVTATSGGTTQTLNIPGLALNGLYHWRARTLYAPFTVTAPDITAPANPGHGPWRRLNGQTNDADIRIGTAYVPASSATFTASPMSSQIVGSSVTFTASGSGGSGSYEYRFRVVNNGVEIAQRSYGTSNTWTWNTAGVTPGTYTVQVRVRNAGSTAAFEAYWNILYSVVSSPPATGATLSASPANSQIVGQPVLFTAGGSGGSGSYEYRFRVVNNGVEIAQRSFGSSNTWTWNTTGVTAGTYTVQVRVRNAGSTAAFEAYWNILFSVVSSPPATGAMLSASPASSQIAGSPVTFTASGSGGSGSYEYRFRVLSNGVEIAQRSFGASNTWTWDTTGVTPGSYVVQARVRNAGSPADFEAYANIRYSVVSP